MRGAWTLTSKLVATGITFLVVALASTGLTLWVSWHLEGGAAAVNEAGRLRMLTYRLASTVEHGDRDGTQRIAHTFDGILDLLEEGDPGRPLFVPWSRASSESFQAIRTHWSSLRSAWLQPAEPPALPQADADAFVVQVDAFVAAIEQELARWTSVLHGFQFLMLLLALATTIVLLYTAHLLVLDPLTRLKTAVASLRDGDLATRLEVDRRDEFGELTEGFNDMADHLQALYDSLEERVREKTAKLEAQRSRLADLYEVSAFAARATQIDELAQGFARRMRRIAGAQAAAVRWSDETNSRYVLLAADNLPENMAREEACVETGSCLCGQPRQDATARIIPILRESSAPLGHCARHGFGGLVSVPIRLHDQVLGEINLFFTDSPDPAGTDRELLEALAGHLAGAMEGLRAGALEREAAVAQERTLLASELHDSIAQSLAFLKIQVQLLRSALQQGDRAALERVAGELGTGVRETYSDVRELLMHFRTRTSEEDIGPALETTLAKFEHQTGLRTQLRIDGRGVRAARRRAGAGAAHRAGGVVQRAQARRRARSAGRGHLVAELALRGARRRPRLRRPGRAARRDARRPAHHEGARPAHRRERAGAVATRPGLLGGARAAARRYRHARRPARGGAGMNEPIRLLVVDDHTLFRRGLVALLASQPGVQVVGEAGDASQALREAQRLQPAVILLDNHLPGVTGIQALAGLREACPQALVLMLTVSEDELDVQAALRNGAQGYLLKTIDGEDLVASIRRAMAGETVVSPELTPRLLAAMRQPAEAAPVDPLAVLSAREQEVLREIALGASNKEIARSLSIAETTVKIHVQNILRKLNLHSRVQAAVFASRCGDSGA